MWSQAGNQAIDQPIQQLCSWVAQAADPAAWAWDSRACSWRIQLLSDSKALKWLCAWSPGLESLRAALGLNQVALGSEVLGLWWSS